MLLDEWLHAGLIMPDIFAWHQTQHVQHPSVNIVSIREELYNKPISRINRISKQCITITHACTDLLTLNPTHDQNVPHLLPQADFLNITKAGKSKGHNNVLSLAYNTIRIRHVFRTPNTQITHILYIRKSSPFHTASNRLSNCQLSSAVLRVKVEKKIKHKKGALKMKASIDKSTKFQHQPVVVICAFVTKLLTGDSMITN